MSVFSLHTADGQQQALPQHHTSQANLRSPQKSFRSIGNFVHSLSALFVLLLLQPQLLQVGHQSRAAQGMVRAIKCMQHTRSDARHGKGDCIDEIDSTAFACSLQIACGVHTFQTRAFVMCTFSVATRLIQPRPQHIIEAHITLWAFAWSSADGMCFRRSSLKRVRMSRLIIDYGQLGSSSRS